LSIPPFLARLIPTYNDLLVNQEGALFMETNRVLSRVGARLLNDEELQQISGGFSTGACVWDLILCRPISGDCQKFPPACGS